MYISICHQHLEHRDCKTQVAEALLRHFRLVENPFLDLGFIKNCSIWLFGNYIRVAHLNGIYVASKF